MESEPTLTSDRVCTSCEPGTFSARTNERQCTRCLKMCGLGQYLSDGYDTCPSTEGNKCLDCGAGEYNLDFVATTCKKWRGLCPPGQEEYREPTATYNRACTPCAFNKWRGNPEPSANKGVPTGYDLNRKCTAHTVCDPGRKFESQPPTAVRDRECTKLTQCTAEQYEAAAPTPTSDRVCETATTTAPTTVVTSTASAPSTVASESSEDKAKKQQRSIILVILVVVVSLLCLGILWTLLTKKAGKQQGSHNLATAQRGDILSAPPAPTQANPHYKQAANIGSATAGWQS